MSDNIELFGDALVETMRDLAIRVGYDLSPTGWVVQAPVVDIALAIMETRLPKNPRHLARIESFLADARRWLSVQENVVVSCGRLVSLTNLHHWKNRRVRREFDAAMEKAARSGLSTTGLREDTARSSYGGDLPVVVHTATALSLIAMAGRYVRETMACEVWSSDGLALGLTSRQDVRKHLTSITRTLLSTFSDLQELGNPPDCEGLDKGTSDRALHEYRTSLESLIQPIKEVVKMVYELQQYRDAVCRSQAVRDTMLLTDKLSLARTKYLNEEDFGTELNSLSKATLNINDATSSLEYGMAALDQLS